MATKLQIVNVALTDLGADTVVSLESESTREANAVNTYYDIILESLLGAHTWDFAKVVVSLAEDGGFTIVDEKFEYVYMLPADFIRPGAKKANDFEFERRDSVLLTDETPCTFEYIAKIEDANQYPHYFVDAMIELLKAKLAIPLKKRGTEGIKWFELFDRVLKIAKGQEAEQSGLSTENKGYDGVTDDPWNKLFD